MTEIADTDCVVLAGGLGKRLRSVDQDNPKVLIGIEDRPFMDILLHYLAGQGFRRVILCVGYKADAVEEYYQSHDHGLDILFSKEDEPLGTGGAIKNARKHLRSSTFFALNGDVYCEFEYGKMLDFHRENSAVATLAVAKIPENKDFGSITLDDDMRIKQFNEKKSSEATCNVSVGIYCFEESVFDFMPEKESFSIEYDVFPKLTAAAFYGFFTDREFIDIGTPERYEQAKKLLQEKLK